MKCEICRKKEAWSLSYFEKGKSTGWYYVCGECDEPSYYQIVFSAIYGTNWLQQIKSKSWSSEHYEEFEEKFNYIKEVVYRIVNRKLYMGKNICICPKTNIKHCTMSCPMFEYDSTTDNIMLHCCKREIVL